MIDTEAIVELQSQMVVRWHERSVDNPYVGFLKTVCQQHSYNFQLWHEEDIARSPDVEDSEIAQVKRSIDRFNQQRNDWIERVDDEIAHMLEAAAIVTDLEAPLNTETPGSVIDRLSILSLRIFHLLEQLDRVDVDQQHIASVQQKIAICQLQQHDLQNSLQELLDAIFAGEKRHRTYRQLKMYNDPMLNPYLYRAKRVA